MAKLQDGIAAFKAGDRAKAKSLFIAALKQDERNEMAWLWLAGMLDDPQQRLDCIKKVLEINPGNEQARKAMAQLAPSKPTMPTKPLPDYAIISFGSTGQAYYPLNVVGESHYQDNLRELADPTSDDDEYYGDTFTATLTLEDGNSYDPNAVRVEIDDKVVGYLSRSDAIRYRDMLKGHVSRNGQGICTAAISGRRDGPGEEMILGVYLDIDLESPTVEKITPIEQMPVLVQRARPVTTAKPKGDAPKPKPVTGQKKDIAPQKAAAKAKNAPLKAIPKKPGTNWFIPWKKQTPKQRQRSIITSVVILVIACICCGTAITQSKPTPTASVPTQDVRSIPINAPGPTDTPEPIVDVKPTDVPNNDVATSTEMPVLKNTSKPTSDGHPTNTSVSASTPKPASSRTPISQATDVPVCTCSKDYDCSDFGTQKQAQACFNYCGGSSTFNWSKLDGSDKDGKVCESLP